VGDWTHTVSNSVVNDARFGWNHIVLNTGPVFDPSVGAFGQTIGIPNSNPAGLSVFWALILEEERRPVQAAARSPISVIARSCRALTAKCTRAMIPSPGRMAATPSNLAESICSTPLPVFYSGNSGELGGMTFGPNFTASAATDPLKNTGEGMADFFLGLPTAFGRGLSGGATWRQTSNIFSGFGEDTWRVSDHLTLTLGLRYEAHTPWIEVNNEQTNYNIQTGQIEYAGQDGNSRSLYNGVYGGKDFQPRLGFAYTPGWSGGHTVFRGAFTISDYLEGTGTNLRLPINPPFNGGATAGGEFQTQYLLQPLPTTTASQGIIAPPPAGLFVSQRLLLR